MHNIKNKLLLPTKLKNEKMLPSCFPSLPVPVSRSSSRSSLDKVRDNFSEFLLYLALFQNLPHLHSFGPLPPCPSSSPSPSLSSSQPSSRENMLDFPEITLDSLQLYEKAVIENTKNEGNTINKDKVCEIF